MISRSTPVLKPREQSLSSLNGTCKGDMFGSELSISMKQEEWESVNICPTQILMASFIKVFQKILAGSQRSSRAPLSTCEENPLYRRDATAQITK